MSSPIIVRSAEARKKASELAAKSPATDLKALMKQYSETLALMLELRDLNAKLADAAAFGVTVEETKEIAVQVPETEEVSVVEEEIETITEVPGAETPTSAPKKDRILICAQSGDEGEEELECLQVAVPQESS